MPQTCNSRRTISLISIWIGAILCLVMTQAAHADDEQSARDRLTTQCDQLLLSAIKRPYGIAWGKLSGENEGRKITPKIVQLEPGATPAAGLLLLWAGQRLDEPRYTDAAWQTGRALMAAQDTSGRVPSSAVFGTNAGSRDELMAVADRSATRAALGLWLMLIRDGKVEDERLSRSSQRAAIWLAKQQASTGAWPSAHPPDAPPGESKRIIRLDNNDYRDSTMALYLAADVLGEPTFRKSADRAAARLVELRIADRSKSATLWPTAAPLGEGVASLAGIYIGLDVLASRLSMQTLLGAYLYTGEKSYIAAIDQAAQAISVLPKDANGRWDRLYSAKTGSPMPTTQQVETDGVFARPSQPDAWSPGFFGIEDVTLAVIASKTISREDYLAMLGTNLDLQQYSAAAAAGLTDGPFHLSLPVTKREAQDHLQKLNDDSPLFGTLTTNALAEQTQAGWKIFLRFLVEERANRP